MTIDEIQSKFTRVVKIAGEWSCYLQVENQSFCITSGQTKQGATWYAKMLAIALERMIEIDKTSEQKDKAVREHNKEILSEHLDRS